MTLHHEHDDDLLLLRGEGELDAAVVPALLSDVARLVAGAHGVVLDLGPVTFFDSSGVRLVDRLQRVCADEQVPLRIVAPPGGAARHVLDLVGMSGAGVCDDVEAARREVRSAARTD